MKKPIHFALPIILAAGLSACSSGEEAAEAPAEGGAEQEQAIEPPVEQPSEEASNGSPNTGTSITMDDSNTQRSEEIPFRSFELEVDYEGMANSYEADYSKAANNLTTEIDDEVNGQHLSGQEAFDQLQPILKDMQFTANTPEEEVIQEVLQAFNLQNNYEEFELEAELTDGSRVEVEG
ncbi:YusW family protein [Bacillus thermotolerans]|uniref:Lipoprotein n=1 Tax=Bacillus thermotolerans TaxID=1221996 RepID=A0A0F5ICT7_BACTR|nr:YusW family protein [Bacillus thermotolerans]KKB43326.1 putative lipoprotein [Bacillus thermotolerans]